MRLRYSVDKDNRLIIRKGKKNLAASGAFSIDKSNRLIYRLNKSQAWRRQYALPPRIVFKGTWNLDSNYDLTFTLDRNKSQIQGDALTIQGNIISTDRDILVFEIKTYDNDSLLHIQILKLNIILFADENNRLCFTVKKLRPDILPLEGDWQINQNQQIIYEYERSELKTKSKIFNTLTFSGFWQITEADRLTYILKHSSSSRFDFRAQIETPTVYPHKGVIKYRLGIGVRENKQAQKIISLYGTWKFSRNLGLVFQMDYNREGWESIEFGADVTFQEDTVAFSLRNKAGEPLGLTLTFTHRFLKKIDAEAFLRLKALGREPGIEVGLKVPF